MARKAVLTVAHTKFVAGIVAGKTQTQAARDAGFVGKQAGRHLMRCKLIRAELEKQTAIVREATGYNAAAMMEELDRVIEHAKETENAGAYVKAVELKGKLHGLLIERVDQRQVAAFSINISGIDDPKPALPPPAAEPPEVNAAKRLAEIFE